MEDIWVKSVSANFLVESRLEMNWAIDCSVKLDPWIDTSFETIDMLFRKTSDGRYGVM